MPRFVWSTVGRDGCAEVNQRWRSKQMLLFFSLKGKRPWVGHSKKGKMCLSRDEIRFSPLKCDTLFAHRTGVKMFHASYGCSVVV